MLGVNMVLSSAGTSLKITANIAPTTYTSINMPSGYLAFCTYLSHHAQARVV